MGKGKKDGIRRTDRQAEQKDEKGALPPPSTVIMADISWNGPGGGQTFQELHITLQGYNFNRLETSESHNSK